MPCKSGRSKCLNGRYGPKMTKTGRSPGNVGDLAALQLHTVLLCQFIELVMLHVARLYLHCGISHWADI